MDFRKILRQMKRGPVDFEISSIIRTDNSVWFDGDFIRAKMDLNVNVPVNDSKLLLNLVNQINRTLDSGALYICEGWNRVSYELMIFGNSVGTLIEVINACENLFRMDEYMIIMSAFHRVHDLCERLRKRL